MNHFDLILQNNGSKEYFLFQGLQDTGKSHLYHKFEVVIDVPDGEYTYCLLRNNRDDVEYDYRTPLLDTIVKADGKETLLKYLQPDAGLVRFGDVSPVHIYDDKNNNTIFYYDGE